jgi:hypothetical protein
LQTFPERKKLRSGLAGEGSGRYVDDKKRPQKGQFSRLPKALYL